jgi:hypothetical protein
MPSPIIVRAPRTRIVAIAAIVLAVAACDRRDEAPRTPLDRMGTPSAGTGAGAAASSGRPVDSLNAEARAALARGNEAMRAKRHREALLAYREAAKAAPHNATSYFGIQMAARALGDNALADSAARLIRALSPADDSTPVDPHALPPGHP